MTNGVVSGVVSGSSRGFLVCSVQFNNSALPQQQPQQHFFGDGSNIKKQLVRERHEKRGLW
jgi:hypothetical protein